MPDLYTLTLTIDPSGMVTGAARAGDAAKKAGDETEKLGDKTKRGTDKAKKELESLGTRAGRLAGELTKALAIGGVFRAIIKNTTEAQGAVAQLEAGLRSTGGASRQTVAGLVAYSQELQRTTAFGDDAVQASQAMLLTFTKIGGDTFPRATRAVADLATRMGTDLRSSALQVGKALNDPILGVTMLSRSGVQFTAQQKEMIATLQRSGDMLGAQNIVLKELEMQFGGSAAAARDTFGGAIAGLKNVLGDMFEVSEQGGSVFVDIINSVADAVVWLDGKIRAFFGGFQILAVEGAASFHGFGQNVKIVLSYLIDGFAALLKPLTILPVIGSRVARVLDGISETTSRWRAEARMTKDALAVWVEEQSNLIAGVGQAERVVTRATAAIATMSDEEREATDAIKARVTELRVERDAIERRMRAELDGEDATERLRVTLAEEAVTREYGNKVNATTLALLVREVRLREEAAIAAEKQTKALDEKRKRDEDERKRIEDAAKKAREEAEKQAAYVTENLTRGMQDAFAAFFETTLTDGLRSFRTLFDGIRQLFVQMLAQMLAAAAMKRVGERLVDLVGSPGVAAGGGEAAIAATGLYARFPNLSRNLGLAGAGLAGVAAGQSMGPLGGAAAGAASGFALAGPVGGVIGAVSGLVSGLFGQSARAKQAAAMMRQARREFDEGVEAFADAAVRGTRTTFENLMTDIGENAENLTDAAYDIAKRELKAERNTMRFLGERDGERVLGGAVVGRGDISGNVNADIAALEALLAENGSLSKASRAYLDRLYEIRDAYNANAEAAAAALAAEQKLFDEDLRVRELLAEGRNAEAEAMRRQLAWERELQKAREQGLDTTQLERTQAAERDRAARDAANALADAEKAAIGERTVSAVSSALTQDTAGRVLGELVAIRVATRQIADVATGRNAFTTLGTGVNSNSAGAFAGASLHFTFNNVDATDARALGEQFAEAADRALGARARARALHAGRAVVRRPSTPTGTI